MQWIDGGQRMKMWGHHPKCPHCSVEGKNIRGTPEPRRRRGRPYSKKSVRNMLNRFRCMACHGPRFHGPERGSYWEKIVTVGEMRDESIYTSVVVPRAERTP